MIQFQAGYILDSVKGLLRDKFFVKTRIDGLLKYLSCFDVDTNSDIDIKSFDPIASVIHNLISKGIPTRPSIFIEERFMEAFNKYEFDLSESTEQLGNIHYLPKFLDDDKQYILESLHVIDPRLKLDISNYGYHLDSSFEEDFIFAYLPSNNCEFLSQVLESQRKVASIVKPEAAGNFHSQKVDFTFEFPYLHEETITIFHEKKISLYNKGMVIEIDGTTHARIPQQILDSQRNSSMKETHWLIKRINNFNTTDFTDWIKTSISIKILQNNYNKLLEGDWLTILQLTLSPFAIARVQKTIIDLILSNNLELNKTRWNILAIERDVPCVTIAIEDLRQQFENLYLLSNETNKFPEILLTVLSTREFINSDLHLRKPELIDSFISDEHFDLIIDVSMFIRSNILKAENNFRSKNFAIVRSAHYINSQRKIYTSDIIEYKPIV